MDKKIKLSKAMVNFVVETENEMIDKCFSVPMELLTAYFGAKYGVSGVVAEEILTDFEEIQQFFVDDLKMEKFLNLCDDMKDYVLSQCDFENSESVAVVSVRTQLGIKYAI